MTADPVTLAEPAPVGVLELDEKTDLASPAVRARVRATLEAGELLYLPNCGFALTERERQITTDPDVMFRGNEERSRRNGRPTLTFNPATDRLQINLIRSPEKREVEAMLRRYAVWSRDLLQVLVPDFAAACEQNRIIYRPVSRKQTQGLHVDSSWFHPTQGRSKLRIFCNIDPKGRDRVWQVGEPFENLVRRFLPQVRGKRSWLEKAADRLAGLAGIVEGRHTDYDYLLADLRDVAKHDKAYQKSAPRRILEFPVGSAWVGMTDVVLHGAISGQHALDQVFFVPPEAFNDPARSAIRMLERFTGRSLA